MVIYDKNHETICVSTMREAKGFALESADEADSCASVADSETADAATVFGKMEVDNDRKTENKA